jgi:hypothetical protein
MSSVFWRGFGGVIVVVIIGYLTRSILAREISLWTNWTLSVALAIYVLFPLIRGEALLSAGPALRPDQDSTKKSP